MKPIPGHDITVTDDGIRTHVECSCGFYQRKASMRGGNIAALYHYINHQTDPQAAKEAARQLELRKR